MKAKNKLGKYYRKHRNKMLNYQNDYNEENRGRVYMTNAGRRAQQKYNTEMATDEKELEQMANVYAESIRKTRETGIRYVVDHIHPLCKGGKHCLSNLQVITSSENAKKYHQSDKHLPDPNTPPPAGNITLNVENMNIYMTSDEYLKVVNGGDR